MFRRVIGLLLAAAFIASFSTGCRSTSYGDKGALFGGVVGAGTGAAIGQRSGNPVAGALIGTAVGAITGNAIGEGIDEDVARNRAEVEARMGRQMAAAVTPEDVVAMTQAGLGDEVIATHIRAHGVAQPPQVNDLITLRNQGVSDNVLKAMQTSPGPQTARVNAPGASPVIIQERVYAPHPYYGSCWGPPPPHFGYRHGHHHGHHRHRSGYSVGVSF
ncbi:MAG: DUF1269 domain-containing protein [Pirellulaceae bacterium]|nr:DUF1269 domain-containing protein [Pirellulaceae bacterium]